ncbi:PEP-CTERM system TPR-repeat protein PrsT [Congregibacter variabilis]|uniref:PEP-CTERM system TPR-repeat protein PrsT n=1 Tax=Congregibacter variabilis TaxID=3081200 RepID=A0ABZ0I717_9GAMM|nr:PEP-CTERM system TPR-repeat protein PrsT [Congregibacter sp. IMCC43200]
MNKAWVLRVMFMSGVIVATACTPPPTEEELLTRARQALERRDVAAAVIDAKSALQQNPDNPIGRFILGRAYLWQTDVEAAVDEFRRAAGVSGTGAAEARVWLMRALVESGQIDKALALDDAGIEGALAAQWLAGRARAKFIDADAAGAREDADRAHSLAPEDPYVSLTLVLLDADVIGGIDIPQAAQRVEAIIEAHPQALEARSYLADLYMAQQAYAAAIEQLQWVVARNPYRISDRLKLVAAHTDNREIAAAEEELKALEAVIPDSTGVKFSRARLQIGDGSYTDASRTLAEVLSANPRHGPSLFYAGVANLETGNLATAQRQLRQFLDQQPNNELALTFMARVELALGNEEEAMKIAREGLIKNPASSALMSVLAMALVAQGSYAEAVGAFEAVTELEPDSVIALQQLSSAQGVAGDLDAAIENLRTAQRLDPDNGVVLEGLVGALLRSERLEEAREVALEYRERSPDLVDPLLTSSRVELVAGELGAAREYLNRARDIDSENAGVYRGFAALALASGDEKEALRELRIAVEKAPDDTQLLTSLAAIEGRANNTSEAALLLERALSVNPDLIPVRVTLARYRLSQGDANAALDVLGVIDVKQLQPSLRPEVWGLLATAQLTVGDIDGASDSVLAALKLAPDNADLLALAAQTQIAVGRFKEALDYVEAGLASEPERLDLLRQQASLQAALGNWDAAQLSLAAMPQEVRRLPAIMALEGRVALGRERYDEAEALFREALSQESSVMYLTGMSTAQWLGGDRDAAIQSLKDWLQSRPEELVVRNQMALWLLEAGRSEEALDEYLILEKQAPENALVLNNLAWLARETDPQQALAWIELAYQQAADNPAILDTYAMVEMAAGNLEAALMRIDAALELAPGKPDLILNRAKILMALGQAEAAQSLLREILSGPESPAKAAARELIESAP